MARKNGKEPRSRGPREISIGLSTIFAVGLGACGHTVQPTPERQPTAHPTLAEADPSLEQQRNAQTWREFLDQRQAYLDTLTEPLVACAERSTSPDPGPSSECTPSDWPQLMQAAHALSRAYLHTHYAGHARAANLAVAPAVIEATRLDLREHGVQADPYAYVWVLVVARTRLELHSISLGDESLEALADEVAQGLEGWLHQLPEHERSRGVLLGTSNSVAWVVQNLWQWAQARGDAPLADRMQRYTAQQLLTEQYDQWCSLSVDTQPEAFELFPPCLHRVLAVLTVMPPDHTATWIEHVLEDQTQLQPITEAPLATQAALNFSRSWGLWALYRATGNTDYKRAYARHIMAQMDASRWDRVREQDKPWVAEFGVYAIDMSYPVDDPAY